ncbi:killer cell immunoglobulin-like receptor 2DL4 [Echinops telfairi]|uniref:Killer cell immunoglobulin-like receptor 2DL4 n=1 Tax=Echinops telfairi TaxID=9371 RepID=A0AC55D9A1_ECHTE|nr:killer cell immunoglobulin-like receptor 2DL4 [Echinops telfairi]
MFTLYKEDGTLISEIQSQTPPNHFLMGPVTPAHAGIYKCYGHYHDFSTWSASSDPLEIMVTGLYRKPSLSAQGGPMKKLGETVTLWCRSELQFDTYVLYKEEGMENTSQFVERLRIRGSLGDFFLGAMTPDHTGTYRCSGSHSHSPSKLSAPSDRLQLMLTGNHRHMHLLIGPSVVIIILAIVIVSLIHRWCPAKNQSTVLNREPEVDQMVNGEDPEAEDSQEVTYSVLNHRIFKKEKIVPPSQGSKDPSVDSSVYTELTVPEAHDTMHQDYMVGNLIQLSIAGLVLVALLVILIEDWHSHRCYTKKIGRLDWAKLEEIEVSHKMDP